MVAAYILIFRTLLIANVVAAWCWGRAPERIAAGLFLAGAILTHLVIAFSVLPYRYVEAGLVSADAVVLGGLVVITAWYDRWWPKWMAALQMISTLAHLSAAANPGLLRLGYAIMEQLSSLPTQLMLSIAIWQVRKRSARPGAAPSCATSSPAGPGRLKLPQTD